jgi:hypothetical protein
MPERLLRQLAKEGKFTAQLGHRSGPQSLLEFLALEYQYDEAMTTLALSYYAVAKTSEFRYWSNAWGLTTNTFKRRCWSWPIYPKGLSMSSATRARQKPSVMTPDSA